MEEEQVKRLVRAAARGDRKAAEALFDHFHPRIYRYAYAKLREASAADDVAAETFAVVLGRLDRFKWRGGGFQPWIFRIAGNLITDHFRKQSRERASASVSELADGSHHDTPESRALTGEHAGEIRVLLDTLPAEQREVLLLRFGADMGTDEVARVMSKKPNAIRQLQFRALTNLRARLVQEVAR